MSNAADNQSIAESDFVQAELADFDDDEQQNTQPNVGGHQIVSANWTRGQSAAIDDVKDMQIGMLKSQITILEKNCALLEEKLENVKLRGFIEKENHKKEIEQIKRDFAGKLKKSAEEQTHKMAQMKADLLRECQQNMDAKEKVTNGQIEQTKHEMMTSLQQKMAEMRETTDKEIEQLKQDSIANQKKIAELQEAASRKWHMCNPKRNKWDETCPRVKLSDDGLTVTHTAADDKWDNFFAAKSFAFAACDFHDDCVQVKYYEIQMKGCKNDLIIGLSAEKDFRRDNWVGGYANSFSITPIDGINCYDSCGSPKQFVWPSSATKPKLNWTAGSINVYGCGMLAWPDGKRAVFFTANGTLLGKEIPLGADVPPLYPAASMIDHSATLEANFGDDPAIQFAYDINNCPVLNLKTN